MRQLSLGQQQAVYGTEQDADDNAEDHAENRVQLPLYAPECHKDCGQSHDVADGQVDTCGQDGSHNAHGQEAIDQGLLHQVLEVVDGQELVRDNGQNDGHDNYGHERAGFTENFLYFFHFNVPPVASVKISSEV